MQRADIINQEIQKNISVAEEKYLHLFRYYDRMLCTKSHFLNEKINIYSKLIDNIQCNFKKKYDINLNPQEEDNVSDSLMNELCLKKIPFKYTDIYHANLVNDVYGLMVEGCESLLLCKDPVGKCFQLTYLLKSVDRIERVSVNFNVRQIKNEHDKFVYIGYATFPGFHGEGQLIADLSENTISDSGKVFQKIYKNFEDPAWNFASIEKEGWKFDHSEEDLF